MNAPTDWTSAVAVLVAGLILGLMLFSISKRRRSTAVSKRAELEKRRDSLVQQLRELGDDAGDEDRAWLEKETAEVLRALDRLPEQPAAAAPRKPRSALSGFAWGVASTVAVVGIVYYASTYVSRDAGNTDAEIAGVKEAFARNDLAAAFERSNAILEREPEDPRALTYNAAVRLSMGEVEKASSMLELATQKDPKFLDGWIALAQARLHAGRTQDAVAAINSAIEQHPEQEARIRDTFTKMRDGGDAAAHASLPPDHPPLPGSEVTMPPVAGSSGAAPAPGKPIHITLSLDPSVPPRGGIVYVIARGGESGHPVAVRRIDTNDFPVTLDFGADDSMMGATLPDKVRIEARLDSDGDAGTNEPGDLRAAVNGVRAGSSIALTLAKAQ